MDWGTLFFSTTDLDEILPESPVITFTPKYAEDHKCMYCFRQFKSVSKCIKHESTECKSNRTKHTCKYCKKQVRLIKAHLPKCRIKHNKKRSCIYCYKTFSNKHGRAVHMSKCSHNPLSSAYKKYDCAHCGKTLSCTTALKNHIQRFH